MIFLRRAHTVALLASLSSLAGWGCSSQGLDGSDVDDDGSGGSGGSNVVTDADGDGHPSFDHGGDDCDDDDASVHPRAPDQVGDGVDQNCDGSDGVDIDGDGEASVESGGPDCDDADPDVNTSAPDSGTLSASVIGTDEDYGAYSDSRHVVAPDGSLHVTVRDSYIKSGTNLVQSRAVYGTNRSGSWTWSAIAQPSRGSRPQVADDGTVYVAVIDSDSGVVTLRERGPSASSWTTTTIDTLAQSAGSIDLIVDDQGAAHVLYGEYGATRTTYYASNAGGQWAVSPPLVGTAGGAFALASDGTPHVAFGEGSTGSATVSHASLTANGWQQEVLATGLAYPRVALALDSADQAQVVYSSTSSSSSSSPIDVIHLDGGAGWSASQLYHTNHTVEAMVAAMSEDDTLHLLMTVGGYDDSIYYAVEPVGGAATVHPVFAGNGNTAVYPGWLVLDGDDTHLTYGVSKNLQHGVLAAPNGVDDNCDGTIW